MTDEMEAIMIDAYNAHIAESQRLTTIGDLRGAAWEIGQAAAVADMYASRYGKPFPLSN